MNSDKLAAAVEMYMRRTPFHPFTLVLENGTRLEVDHPRGLMYRNGTGVHGGPEGVPTLFEADGVTEVVGDLARTGERDDAGGPEAG